MDELRRRELGLLLAVDARLTHRPQAFRNAALGNSSLVSRLHPTEQLPASGTLFATAWSDDGSRLLGAGEDCRLRVWAGDGSDLLQTLDTVSVPAPVLGVGRLGFPAAHSSRQQPSPTNLLA